MPVHRHTLLTDSGLEQPRTRNERLTTGEAATKKGLIAGSTHIGRAEKFDHKKESGNHSGKIN